MNKGKLSGVLHKGFKPDKCKTALRMALARIKLLRNKKGVQVRQMRREVAQLLETNQDQTARIRVEHVIREEKFMQAYDLIEVYCELIVARMSIIDSQKTCPIDMKEAIASVIFASMRCSDVTELADVRKQFTSKYGKDFAAAALEVRPDSGVNRLVIEKLSAGAPDVQTKTKTLSSIAEEHNIKWEPKAFEEKLQKENEDLAYGTATYSGGNIPTTGSSASSISTPQPASHSYPSAEVPANRTPYGAVNSNAFSQENIRGSNSSVPPSSQHGSTTSASAEIPGPNNFSHGNTGGPNVSRPYSQYDAAVSDTPAGSKEFNQPRERKSSGSGSNWNVQFKDATSAAQAAAESAEMASIAARAAAQLASRGNFSAEQNTGAFESATYTRETTPRKQQSEHIMKDYKRSFNEQSSGTNDPRVISRNARRDAEREETNLMDSQNMSAPYSSAQFHSYPPESHSDEYGMPTEPHRAHSPESPYSDDPSEKEQHFRRPENHSFNSSRERFPDAQFGGHSIKDMESKQPSFGQENTNNYYSNYSSSHGTFTHGSSSTGDNQNNNTGADSSTVLFDQYDSDAGEDNLLDPFFSKRTEEPSTVQDHKGFSSADWSQQHRSESPVKHSTSTLFSGTETHPSYSLETNRKDISSPHSYDNAPPTFDSDGASSDEEIATSMHVKSLRSHSRGSGYSESKEDGISGNVVDSVNNGVEDYDSMSRKKYQNASSDEEISTSMHVKSLRSHSRGSGYSESKEDRISGNVVDSVNKGVEDYDSMSRKKYQNAPGFDAFHKEQYGDTSPRSGYSSGDNNLSEEEHKLKGASSDITGANKNQPFSLGMQTSATSDDYDEGDLGLNFGRLTPGLRNKLRQPPPYNKGPRDNMLPNQSVRKAPAIESVNSKENDTSSEQTRNTPRGSSTTKSSFDVNYNSDLNDMNQSPIARREARSTMRRKYFESGDDVERSSERSANAPNSMINQSSVGVHSSQELDHEKSGVGASRETRTRNARSYFDSDDSEEELEQRQTIQTKWSREQMQSRRTQPTSVRTGGQHADETERAAEPIEQRRETPVYSRVPVQRAPSKPVHVEHPTGRGKLQDAELNTSSVPGNEEHTESSAETPKGSASTTAPSHVHPKLPTDYDSFTAHFMSLRANRR